jgi:hypothetical protein
MPTFPAKRLADGILLRLIVATTAAQRGGTTTPMRKRGYARDFLEVVLNRFREGRFGRRRTTTKTTETSRDGRDAVDVRDALRGRVVIVVVHSSPKAPIVGNDCGKGGRGGSVADETITDGAKTTAMTEQGMHPWRQGLRTTTIHTTTRRCA